MAARVCNIAKGRVAHYASLPATNDAIVAVPLLSAGIATEDALVDSDTLAAVLGGSTDENTTMGRKTLTNVTVIVDDTGDQVLVDSDDVSWSAGEMGGGAVARLLYCYDPDTTGGTDADLVPLVLLDAAVTPDGNAWTYEQAAGGWYAATEP